MVENLKMLSKSSDLIEARFDKSDMATPLSTVHSSFDFVKSRILRLHFSSRTLPVVFFSVEIGHVDSYWIF